MNIYLSIHIVPLYSPLWWRVLVNKIYFIFLWFCGDDSDCCMFKTLNEHPWLSIPIVNHNEIYSILILCTISSHPTYIFWVIKNPNISFIVNHDAFYIIQILCVSFLLLLNPELFEDRWHMWFSLVIWFAKYFSGNERPRPFYFKIFRGGNLRIINVSHSLIIPERGAVFSFNNSKNNEDIILKFSSNYTRQVYLIMLNYSIQLLRYF